MELSNSPPRSSRCCFCLLNSKKDEGKRRSGVGSQGSDRTGGAAAGALDGWGENKEILSDMSTFSLKEQERRLKKAAKEEEKATREAERVVNWIKQESARMEIADIDSILGGDDQQKAKRII